MGAFIKQGDVEVSASMKLVACGVCASGIIAMDAFLEQGDFFCVFSFIRQHWVDKTTQIL
jgi:hypothetical protein